MPLDIFFRRRRRLTMGTMVLALLSLLVIYLLDQQGMLLHGGDDLQRYHGKTFLVIGVVDGDTIKLDVPDGDDKITRIRIWGIDTPEIAHPPDPKPAEPFGVEATDLTRLLTDHKTVTVTLESHRPRDRYQRLLAHVELPDGSQLAERLITAGLAHADDRWDHRNLQRYALLEEQAKRDKVGLWSGK